MANTNEHREWGSAIVVVTNGFVWHARSVTYDGLMYNLHGSRCIRTWGTKAGMAELVRGPTKDTVLDAEAPLLSVTSQATVAILPCSEGAWD